MEQSIMNHLDEFISDIGFPIDKSGLVQESYEFPLPENLREAIALLPDREYSSKLDLKEELLGVQFDDSTPKKDVEDEEIDDNMVSDEIVALGEFTQMRDEQNQE